MNNCIQGVRVEPASRREDRSGHSDRYFCKVDYDSSLPHVCEVDVHFFYRGGLKGLYIGPPKICMCVHGAAYNVVVDTRKNSETFGKWYGTWLTDMNHMRLVVPRGCAHGFLSNEDDTILLVQRSDLFGDESVVNCWDKELAIAWAYAEDYIMSDEDRTAMSFADYKLLRP